MGSIGKGFHAAAGLVSLTLAVDVADVAAGTKPWMWGESRLGSSKDVGDARSFVSVFHATKHCGRRERASIQ